MSSSFLEMSSDVPWNLRSWPRPGTSWVYKFWVVKSWPRLGTTELYISLAVSFPLRLSAIRLSITGLTTWLSNMSFLDFISTYICIHLVS